MDIGRRKGKKKKTFMGKAFLTYEEKEQAAEAIEEMHRTTIRTRQIFVYPAFEKYHSE